MLATLAALLVLLLALPAQSRAGCGGVREAAPAHHHDHQQPPLAIGDSTMLLALYNLAGIGYDANAHGCRQLPEALELIHQRKAAGTLPHMVVIALGADGSVSRDQIGQVLGLLCCTRLLVLITPRELGGGSGADAATVREEVAKHPGRAKLLDWVSYSAGHPEWFQPDGIHLTTAGAVAFTNLLREALPWAYPAQPVADKPLGRPRKLRPAATGAAVQRLASAIPTRARVGRRMSIRLRDRWGIGGLPVRICVSPPGAGPDCHRRWIHRGTRRRTIELPVPRPGGWRVSVRGRGGREHRALVWVAHPGGRIRLLAVGDSEMQVLDDFLSTDLAPHGVDVISDARISTGLTKPFFFDWQGHARAQAAGLRPDAIVMFIGANDGFAAGGAPCCGSAWSAGYANLVAQMMRTYLRGDAGRVYWFTLPDPRPGSFSSLFAGVDAGIRAAARRFPGRASLIDAQSFFTPSGYRDFMTWNGHGVVIHEPDGVHLSTSADQVAAQLVVHQMLADRLIR